MKLKVADMLDRLHVIIDDVKRTDGEDDFSEDKDTELREALLTGAEQVTGAAPRSVLVPKPVASGLSIDGDYDYDAARTEYVDGHGAVMIPDDWLRLYELKLRSWTGTVTSLIDAESDEAKMQASRWSRGTAQKPKAMLGYDDEGRRAVVYWTAGRYAKYGTALDSVYDHEIDRFLYIPKPELETETTTVTKDDGKTENVNTEYLNVPLTEACEKAVLYRAAGVFMEAKKESTLAEKFYALGQL